MPALIAFVFCLSATSLGWGAGIKDPLAITTLFPANGATEIDLNITVEVSFNHRILTSSLNDSTFQIRDPSGALVPIVLKKRATGERILATPKLALLPATSYTLTIKGGNAGMISESEIPLFKSLSFSFRTRAPFPRTGLTLMHWSDIAAKLVGTFHLPVSSGGEAGIANNFLYSYGIHAQLRNGNLLVEGNPRIHKQVEVKLPTKLDGSSANTINAWLDVTQKRVPVGWDSINPSYDLGGLLEMGNRLYFTKFQWYNGGGHDWPSIGYHESGKTFGMWPISGPGAHNQRVAGYMSYAPKILSDSGYPMLAGQQGTSGAAIGRWGPNLFALRGNFPASIASPILAKPLLLHTELAKGFPGWYVGDRVSSAVWIETKTQQALLVFLYQQLGGDTWYGEPTKGTQVDPYGGYKGYHASGYILEVWIYDPDVLMEVFTGKRDPGSLRPAEKMALIERAPGDTANRIHSFITGDALQLLQASYRDGRLIILQPNGFRSGPYETDPKGYVLKLE